MTPKIKLLKWIDDFYADDLNEEDKLEFEKELQFNEELKEEVLLEKEIQNAILEKDVTDLRRKIKGIIQTSPKSNDYFDLFEDFSNFEEFNLTVPPEELLDFYDSVPKVHLYHQTIFPQENIHHFYKEQDLKDIDEEIQAEDPDDYELDGLEDAVLEKDIISLRSKLNKVRKLIDLPYTSEEIEKYVSGELPVEEAEIFNKELSINNNLKLEVEIYREVEKALEELDISYLRKKLFYLAETETSWNVSERQIEDFIEGELKGKELEEFKVEYQENSGLKSEVALRQEVNEAIGEKDILNLSDKMKKARIDVAVRDAKSIVPERKIPKIGWFRAGAAVVAVLLMISGLYRNGFFSTDKAYEYFYTSPEWSQQRSADTDFGSLNRANLFFSRGEYLKAIELYDKAIMESKEKYIYHFYKGASLQNLNKFGEAIPEYNMVIEHGDNLFIEEAEWYKSLCYIKLNNEKEAREQLNAIVKKDGFYAKDARAVLRRLRLSFK